MEWIRFRSELVSVLPGAVPMLSEPVVHRAAAQVSRPDRSRLCLDHRQEVQGHEDGECEAIGQAKMKTADDQFPSVGGPLPTVRQRQSVSPDADQSQFGCIRF